MRVPRALVILGAALALVVGGFFVAQAAIPNAQGVFTACISKSDGNVRIIDTAKTTSCKYGEIKRTWNAQGQPGTPGEDGEDGTDGSPGGLAGYEIVVNRIDLTGFGGYGAIQSANCPAGKRVVGGGAEYLSATGVVGFSEARVVTSAPTADGTGWRVNLFMASNPDGRIIAVEVRAACAEVAV